MRRQLRLREDNEYFGLKSSSMIISIFHRGHPILRFRRPIKWPVDGIHTIDVCSLLFSTGNHFHPIRVPSIIETTGHLQRRSPLSALSAEHVIELLTNYTRQTGTSIQVLLVGALALQAYGYHDRLTRDMDAEVVGSIEALTEFLNRHGIPMDSPEENSARNHSSSEKLLSAARRLRIPAIMRTQNGGR